MTTVTEAATKRPAQIAAIHGLADWLADHPAVPMPTLSLHQHLQNSDGTEAENLGLVRRLAADLDVEADEVLDDRTVLRVRVNEHVYYELFAWHKSGRDGELERLRAEVIALRAAAALQPDADPAGMGFSREPEPTEAGPMPEGVDGSTVPGRTLDCGCSS